MSEGFGTGYAYGLRAAAQALRQGKEKIDLDPRVAEQLVHALEDNAQSWASMERQNNEQPDNRNKTRVIPREQDMALLEIARMINGK